MTTIARCAGALGLVMLCAGAPALSDPVSSTGEDDLGALLRQAEATFDLAQEDAVFLVDEFRVTWSADRRRTRSIHRIVYIRTAMGIRQYADLRVPYDSERERLTVSALRTWRLADERWVESGPTARVETLPFALDRAPDYALHREMMLLHDGVELPCILETAYSIEDVAPYRPGAAGLWSFSRNEPVVLSRFVLVSPADDPARFRAGPGVPEPVRAGDGRGMIALSFQAGPLEALPRPRVAGIGSDANHVFWSTWRDWDTLGRDLGSAFAAGGELNDELRTRLTAHLKPARTVTERAVLVAGFVDETTRPIRYDTGFWPTPRSAARTWSTAYGDAVDRAALAASLFREAGLKAKLAFRGQRFGEVDGALPTLVWAGDPGLWIFGEGIQAWFDPLHASLDSGSSWFWGRAVWRPGIDDRPVVRTGGEGRASRLVVRFDLQANEEAQRWEGTGLLDAAGALSTYGEMTGLNSESLDFLGVVARSVLGSAKVTAHNAAIFESARITVGFAVELPFGEKDELGRLRIETGDTGSLSDLLAHAEVDRFDEERGAELLLPAALSQRVEIHLDLGGRTVVYRPAKTTLANSAGRFVVSAELTDDRLSVARELSLSQTSYASAAWTDLRALLLANDREGHRLLLLGEREDQDAEED